MTEPMMTADEVLAALTSLIVREVLSQRRSQDRQTRRAGIRAVPDYVEVSDINRAAARRELAKMGIPSHRGKR